MSKEIDYKSAYESVMILKDMLIKENQQLKEVLDEIRELIYIINPIYKSFLWHKSIMKALDKVKE